MKNRNLRLAKTILISGIGVLISYLINFFLTPYITDRIGIEAYGFVSIAKTATSYAGIITIALTSFIVRFISVSYHENKHEAAQSYYSSSLAACVVLSGLISTVAFIIVSKLEYILNIPDELVASVKLLFVIIFTNFIVTTVTTPLGAAAYIKNRLDATGVIKIVAYIFDAVVMLLMFLLLTPKVWFVGVGTLTASLVTLLFSWLMTVKLTPELKFKRKLVSLSKIRDMMSNGIWNSFNSLGNVLNSGLDLWISNLMLDGVATGQIAVAKTIGTMFSTLYQVVFQPFQPQLLKSYAKGEMGEFLGETRRAMKICGYFSNVAFAGFVSLGGLYFKLWLPNEDVEMLHMLTVVTVLGSITAGVIQPVYYINTLTLKNKLPCWITIASGFLNVGTMYLLIKYTNMGAFAIVITTTVIMISINLFFNPIYSARCLNIKSRELYGVIFRHLLSVAVMTGVFKVVAVLLNPTGWIGLIVTALVMCVIGIFVHVLVMCSKKEKEALAGKVFKKRKN